MNLCHLSAHPMVNLGTGLETSARPWHTAPTPRAVRLRAWTQRHHTPTRPENGERAALSARSHSCQRGWRRASEAYAIAGSTHASLSEGGVTTSAVPSSRIDFLVPDAVALLVTRSKRFIVSCISLRNLPGSESGLRPAGHRVSPWHPLVFNDTHFADGIERRSPEETNRNKSTKWTGA